MKNKNQKEMDMVIDLQDANILPLDITKRQVKYLINRVNKLKEKEIVIAEGEVTIDDFRWLPSLRIGNDKFDGNIVRRVAKLNGKKGKLIFIEDKEEK